MIQLNYFPLKNIIRKKTSIFLISLAIVQLIIIFLSTKNIRELSTAALNGGHNFEVSTSEELLKALDLVTPGDVISLADGRYKGEFIILRSGAPGKRIILQGSPLAKLENPKRSAKDYEVGFGLHLQADHWTLQGFTIQNSRKGIIVDRGNHNILRNLTVIQMDDEGIHFRFGSSHNLVSGCFFNDTGMSRPGFGEAVYIGQDHKKWAGGKADKCNYNDVIGNKFGESVRGECVDVKEGTCCGRIAQNQFDGRGQTGVQTDDNWVDVKGHMYVVEDNVGKWSLKEGFGISSQLPFPGQDVHSACGNLLRRNRCEFERKVKNFPCVACNNGCPCINEIRNNQRVLF